MINQFALKITPYEETEESVTIRDTAGDRETYRKLCEKIARDFTIKKEDEAISGVTTFNKSNIADIFPQKIPFSQETRYSFSVLQEWEGYVVSVSENTFTARLTDITRKCKIEDEEADFSLDDLDDADRLRLSEGAIFRWVIGYRRSPGGTKDRSSRIVLRNLPAWTRKEIEKNKNDAAELASQLNVE